MLHFVWGHLSRKQTVTYKASLHNFCLICQRLYLSYGLLKSCEGGPWSWSRYGEGMEGYLVGSRPVSMGPPGGPMSESILVRTVGLKTSF